MDSVTDLIRALGGTVKATERLQVHKTRISHWIRDGRIPAKHAFTAAEALGVPVETLRPLVEGRRAA